MASTLGFHWQIHTYSDGHVELNDMVCWEEKSWSKFLAPWLVDAIVVSAALMFLAKESCLHRQCQGS